MADFAWEPHRVEPGVPEWNTVSSEMEGMRKKVRLKSTRPKMIWTLFFRGQSTAEKNAKLAHYNGQYKDLIPFNWTSVPSEIGTGPYNVRYQALKIDHIMNEIWELEITFEEVIP